MKKNRAQSTLEYIIVTTAIIAAVVAGAATIGQHVRNAMDVAGDRIEGSVDGIQ